MEQGKLEISAKDEELARFLNGKRNMTAFKNKQNQERKLSRLKQRMVADTGNSNLTAGLGFSGGMNLGSIGLKNVNVGGAADIKNKQFHGGSVNVDVGDGVDLGVGYNNYSKKINSYNASVDLGKNKKLTAFYNADKDYNAKTGKSGSFGAKFQWSF